MSERICTTSNILRNATNWPIPGLTYRYMTSFVLWKWLKIEASSQECSSSAENPREQTNTADSAPVFFIWAQHPYGNNNFLCIVTWSANNFLNFRLASTSETNINHKPECRMWQLWLTFLLCCIRTITFSKTCDCTANSLHAAQQLNSSTKQGATKRLFCSSGSQTLSATNWLRIANETPHNNPKTTISKAQQPVRARLHGKTEACACILAYVPLNFTWLYRI